MGFFRQEYWSGLSSPSPNKWAEDLNIFLHRRYTDVLGASTGDLTHDKVMRRDLTGKGSQVSRGPLPEHPPRNQILSVYCLLYYTLLTLQGVIPDYLSLEKVNLELQLVSCVWKECLSSNPSDGSLTNLTCSPRLLQLVIVYSPPTVRGMKLKKS